MHQAKRARVHICTRVGCAYMCVVITVYVVIRVSRGCTRRVNARIVTTGHSHRRWRLLWPACRRLRALISMTVVRWVIRWVILLSIWHYQFEHQVGVRSLTLSLANTVEGYIAATVNGALRALITLCRPSINGKFQQYNIA